MKTLATAALLTCSSAYAQLDHGDIILTLSPSQQIVTNTLNEQGQTIPQRVFGSEFEAGLPFTNEPGLDSADGVFAPQSQIGFRILKALRLWNGQEFGPVLPGERISVRLGPLGPVLTPTTDTPVTGFALTVNSSGSFHHHPGYTLLPAPEATEPAEGIYLYEVELFSSQSGVSTSRPFWLVFNFNFSEDEHAEAVAWANTHLICAADFNADRVVDFFDYLDFVDQFSSGSTGADFNADGIVDFFDYLDFVAQFSQGCD